MPAWRARYLDVYRALVDGYRPHAGWEPWTTIETRTAALLPGLLLARIDGKSPVEYLTAERDRERVRAFARVNLLRPPGSLSTLAEAWNRA